MKNIKFICGPAGCSKTTQVINLISDKTDFVCLAFTHSAVNNMIEKFLKIKAVDKKFIRDKFKTLHTFFRIPIDKDGSYKIIYHKIKFPKIVIIDEFSLIDLNILSLIFDYAKRNKDSVFVLSGDVCQLNPITKNFSNEFKFENYDIRNIDVNLKEAELILKHLQNNIFIMPQYQNSDKLILTKNYRSNDSVMKFIDSILFCNDETAFYKIIEDNKYVEDNDVIFIGSKYKYLNKIYKLYGGNLLGRDIKTRMGNVKINDIDEYVLTKNLTCDFVNGDVIKFKFDGDDILIYRDEVEMKLEMIDGVYPILPKKFITAHKSQGKSFDKICVILDEMFDISMLYTILTRARSKIYFTYDNIENIKNLYFYTKCFVKMLDVVYSISSTLIGLDSTG